MNTKMRAFSDLYETIYDTDGYESVYDQAFVFYDEDEEIDIEYEQIVDQLPLPNTPPAQA